MNRKIAAGIAGGALALVLLGGEVGLGHAQASVSSAVSAPAAVTSAVPQQAPKRGKQQHVRVAHLLVKTTAELGKLTPKAVLTELRAGKSLNQVAQAHGTSGKAVVDAARVKLQARLNAAVAGGKVTQERADKALQRFDQAAAKLIDDATLGTQLDHARAAHHAL